MMMQCVVSPPSTLNSPPTPLCAVPSSCRAPGWRPWALMALDRWGSLLGAGGSCCPGLHHGWEVQVAPPGWYPRVGTPGDLCTPSHNWGVPESPTSSALQ